MLESGGGIIPPCTKINVCITAAYTLLCTTPTHRTLNYGIVDSFNQKKTLSIISFIVSSPSTSTLCPPMCIRLICTVPTFLDISVRSCTRLCPEWFLIGACRPDNANATLLLLLLISAACAEADTGIFVCASGKKLLSPWRNIFVGSTGLIGRVIPIIYLSCLN